HHQYWSAAWPRRLGCLDRVGVPPGPAARSRRGAPAPWSHHGSERHLRRSRRGSGSRSTQSQHAPSPASPIEPAGQSPDTPITYIHNYDSLEDIYIRGYPHMYVSPFPYMCTVHRRDVRNEGIWGLTSNDEASFASGWGGSKSGRASCR